MKDGFSINCVSGEHGCSNHGDWMNGWEPEVMAKIVDTTNGCLGSAVDHCAAGKINSDEQLDFPANGVQNWEFGTLSFQYKFKHAKPVNQDRPGTTSEFTVGGTGIPAGQSISWEATATCEDSDGNDYQRTFTQAEIQSSLTNDIGFPNTLGTYEYDWLKLGSGNNSGDYAHPSTNHTAPCTGFCFIPTVTSGENIVTATCE